MSELCEDLFGNNSKEKMKLLARAIDSSTFFCSNRGVYSWLPRKVQLEAGTDNTDDIVEALRDMEGWRSLFSSTTIKGLCALLCALSAMSMYQKWLSPLVVAAIKTLPASRLLIMIMKRF